MTSQNNQGSINDISDDESINESIPLTILFKFIRQFSGDRTELNTFIQNANSAFSLASETQKPSLFLYVVSQLSNNVVNEIELSNISSWTELKTILKQFYGQSKHLVQSHEELETIKQFSNESITDFFKRLEKIKNECIQGEIQNSTNPSELLGLKRAIQQTALRRFIIHCKSEISQMLRARNIVDINEAYSIALQEEKILNYTKIKSNQANIKSNSNFNSKYNSNHRSFNSNNKYSTYNHRPPQSMENKGHSNQERHKSYSNSNPNKVYSNHNYNNSKPSTSQSNSHASKFCKYCKKNGHLISECFKKQYNDSKVNNLNLQESALTNVPETDPEIQETFLFH